MAADFIVDYDDFSGGLYVGSTVTKMPKNTWVGDNVLSCEVDGTLMPAGAWVPRSDAAVVSSPPPHPSAGVRVFSDLFATGLFGCDGANLFEETVDVDATHHAWDVAGRAAHVAPLGAPTFARMGPYVVFANLSGNALYLYNQSTGIVTTPSTPTVINSPTVFGEFVVGFANDTLWWSAPTDPTSWPATNFVQVGSSGNGITALVVVGSSLMVGKTDGWWQVTGVLGSSETIVQAATEGTPAGAVVASDGLLAFPGRKFDGSAVRVLRGSVVSTLAYQEAPVPTLNAIYQAGGYMMLAGTLGQILVRSPSGRWHRLNAAHQNGLFVIGLANTPAAHPFGYAWLGTTVGNGFPYRYLLAPLNPPMTATPTAFASGTANLNEYRRATRFKIKEVIVELDLGVTSLNAARQITLTMLTPTQALEGAPVATQFSAAGSTPQTYTLPPLATSNGERVTVRFNPTDGQDTYSMIPQVTLQGVKLRRLLVRAQDVI